MKYLFLIVSVFILFSCQQTTTKNDSTDVSTPAVDSLPIEHIETTSTPEPIYEPEKLASLLETMVPKGYFLYKKQDKAAILATDLDNDGKDDYVVAFIDESYEFARIGIFMQESNGNISLKTQSKDLPASTFDYNHDQLTVKNKVLSFHHQAMRNDLETKFRYEEKHQDIMMIGQELNNYGNATNDGSGNVSVNYLTGVRIEKLNAFNYDTEKLEPLPEKRVEFDKPLIPLSKFDEDVLLSVW